MQLELNTIITAAISKFVSKQTSGGIIEAKRHDCMFTVLFLEYLGTALKYEVHQGDQKKCQLAQLVVSDIYLWNYPANSFEHCLVLAS